MGPAVLLFILYACHLSVLLCISFNVVEYTLYVPYPYPLNINRCLVGGLLNLIIVRSVHPQTDTDLL